MSLQITDSQSGSKRRGRISPLAWAIVAALVVLVALLAARAGLFGVVVFVAIAACTALCAWRVRDDFRPLARKAHTRKSPVAVREIMRERLAAMDWREIRDDPNALTFERRMPLGAGVVVVLLILGIVPALVYAAFNYNRRQSVTLRAAEGGDATLVEMVVRPQGRDGYKIGGHFFEWIVPFP